MSGSRTKKARKALRSYIRKNTKQVLSVSELADLIKAPKSWTRRNYRKITVAEAAEAYQQSKKAKGRGGER